MYDFRPGSGQQRCGRRGGASRETKGRLFVRQAPAALKQRSGSARQLTPLPSPGRIKRNKGVWWMPWQQEAMKDVVLCDKRGGAENRH
jgi:hypothetical protein